MVMEQGGYAANGLKHCVRPTDMAGECKECQGGHEGGVMEGLDARRIAAAEQCSWWGGGVLVATAFPCNDPLCAFKDSCTPCPITLTLPAGKSAGMILRQINPTAWKAAEQVSCRFPSCCLCMSVHLQTMSCVHTHKYT